MHQEVKQYLWEIDKKDMFLFSQITDQKCNLSVSDVSDLTKRILYLVVGGKNNISNITCDNNNEITILIKDKKIINFEVYNFYIQETLPQVLNSKNISIRAIAIDNHLIKIEFIAGSEILNIEFIKAFKEDFYNHKIVIKKLNYLVIETVISNAYDKIFKYDQNLKNELQLMFKINSEKEKLEKDLFNQIKKQIVWNQELQKLYNINDQVQNSEIRKIKALIIKKIEQKNKIKPV